MSNSATPKVRRALKPSIQFRPKAEQSILNVTAQKALTADGSRFLMLFHKDGRLCLKPFDMDGLLTITPINKQKDGRGGVGLALDIRQRYRVALEWNEEGGFFETGEVLKPNERHLGPSSRPR